MAFSIAATSIVVHGYDIQVIIKYTGSSTVQQGGTIYWTANYTAAGTYPIMITQVNASFDNGPQRTFVSSDLPRTIPISQHFLMTLFIQLKTTDPVGTHQVVFSTGWNAYIGGAWVTESPLVDDKVPPFQIIAPIVVTAPTVHVDYSTGSTVEQGMKLNFTATYQSSNSNTGQIRIMYTNATVDGVQLSFSGPAWPVVLQPGDTKQVALSFRPTTSYPVGSHSISFTTKWQSNENSQWTDHDPVTSSNLAPFQVISAPGPAGPGGGNGSGGGGGGGGGIDPIYFVAIGVAIAAVVISAMLVTRRGTPSAALVPPATTTTGAPTAVPTTMPLANHCSYCKAELRPGAVFCPECGAKVG